MKIFLSKSSFYKISARLTIKQTISPLRTGAKRDQGIYNFNYKKSSHQITDIS